MGDCGVLCCLKALVIMTRLAVPLLLVLAGMAVRLFVVLAAGYPGIQGQASQQDADIQPEVPAAPQQHAPPSTAHQGFCMSGWPAS